jgi:hypothetical protein
MAGLLGIGLVTVSWQLAGVTKHVAKPVKKPVPVVKAPPPLVAMYSM